MNMPTPQIYEGTYTSELSFLPARTYAVVYDELEDLLAASWTTLLANCKTVPAILVTPREPERELASLSNILANKVRHAISAGNIRVFQWQSSAGSSSSPPAILEELEHFGLGRGALVIIAGAGDFFSSGNKTPATLYRSWAEQHDCSLLLLSPFRSDKPDPSIYMGQAADCIAGYARLRRSDGNLWFDIFHWFGRETFAAGQSFELTERGDNTLVMKKRGYSNIPHEPAADEDAVLAVRSVLREPESAPAAWHIFADVKSLVAASAGATASTVILPFEEGISLNSLSRTIFELRRSCGSRLKIVVCEVAHRLRYSHEQLLLRSGATMVIPVEVGMSRFISLVEVVQGKIFTRHLDADYETAVAAFFPSTGSGYQAPADFLKEVSASLRQEHTRNSENALVRLLPVSGVSPLDGLRYCTMTRPGDYCTADKDTLYLWLPACRDCDISATLDRLFRLPVSEMFSSEIRYITAESIRDELEKLNLRASVAELPDLKPELTGIFSAIPVRESMIQSTVPLAETMRRIITAPAIRHPLTLRTQNAVEKT